MGIYARGGVFYARFTKGGVLRRVSLGTGEREAAQRKFLELTGRRRGRRAKRKARKAGSCPTTPALEGGRPVALEDAATLWIEAVRADHRLRRTSKASYVAKARQWQAWTWCWDPLSEIDTRAVERYLDQRAQNGKTSNTRKQDARLLLIFLRWCRDQGWIERVPTVPRVKGGTKRVLRSLNDEEIARIFEIMRGDSRPQIRALEPFVMVQLHCGLRREEVRWLTWDDVDLDGAQPELRVSVKPGFEPKDSEERVVPISPALADYLRQHRERRPAGAPWICLNTQKGQWRHNSMAEALRKLWESAGISLDRGTSHRLRHSFATRLVERTGDLVLARDLLGHSDISTTSGYVWATRQRHVAIAAMAEGLPGPAGDLLITPGTESPGR